MNAIDIISASAGSGKTFRLTQMLEEGVASGKVRPQAVLATTFTIKSAAELQERVRIRLLAAGRTLEAQQITAATIGTVNSVCDRLVSNFAFELGLSPDLRVLDEEPAEVALHRALSEVLSPEDETELADLTERMEEFDWHATAGAVISLARANGLSADALRESARRSRNEFRKLFGDGAGKSDALDQALLKVSEKFLNDVAKGNDTTRGTANAVERVRQAVHRMQSGVALAWKDWVALAKLKATKASDGLLEPVRIAAAAQDRHPRLHRDVDRAIELVFDLAVRTLDSYQEHKRQLGAIDFVDQESYALGLLQRPAVRDQLAGELDLVLIDEFQDTSPIQLAIFLRLAEAAPRSVWVGDQKQAIYGFRGADPALMDAAIDEILGGKEPETLPRSYRSRPGLVRFTSSLFAPAFALQGIPKNRVHLEPENDNEPAGLGPVMECWTLQTKNQPDDAAALAAAVKAMLNDSSVRVRDRKDGQSRPVRAGDVALLCRTNNACLELAGHLADLGIRPVLPRQGLLSTLEGRAAMAALRLWVDSRDSLAAAELARLTEYAGREQDWLKTILDRPGQAAFADLPLIAKLVAASKHEQNLGVVAVFDTAAQSVGLSELCLRWGHSEARLANVEAFRGHVVVYANSCASQGTGCSPAGLVAYLAALAEAEADSQGVDEDDHAVVVSTWHGAKGLEWPIVVLFPLSRRDSHTLALGVKVQSDREKVELSDPLAGRWIRYWPNPYAGNNNGTPFHDRLAEHPITQAARVWAEREDLRLLYVGWTRARDRVVLAGRSGKIAGDLLQLLKDVKGPLVSEPQGPQLTWAGTTIDVVIRESAPLSKQVATPVPGSSYVAPGERAYPSAFVQPSGVAGTDVLLTLHERIGGRIGITGNPEWSQLGMALHGFLCSDRPGLTPTERDSMVTELLNQWGVGSAVNTKDVCAAADSLRRWISKNWPEAEWCREWPVLFRNENGSVIRGSSDLVLKVPGGLVVIDHKSFPGSAVQALVRAAEYVGQLRSYASAIEAATAQKVLSTWIHLPVSGIVVPLP